MFGRNINRLASVNLLKHSVFYLRIKEQLYSGIQLWNYCKGFSSVYICTLYVYGTHVEQQKCECLKCLNACRHMMFGQSRTNMINFLATLKATELTESPADSHGNLKICDATLWTIWCDLMWWQILTSCPSDLPFLLWSEDSAGSVSLFCDVCWWPRPFPAATVNVI